MKGKFVLFMLCIGLSFFSCSNVTDDTSSNPPNNNALKYLDITDAKNLYISTGNANRSAGNGASSQKIFKITEGGYVEEVKYLDENKNEITISNQPTAILPVNDKYIFVGFGWGDSISSSYLVRKSDGAVFDMKNAGRPEKIYNDYKNGNMIKTDKNNNMYFLSYDMQNSSNTRIVKVNLSGIDSLSSSFISPSTDRVEVFDVDWNGNIIYKGYSNSSDTSTSRVIKSNGGLEYLEDTMAFWIGLDGNIYYSSWTDYKNSEPVDESYQIYTYYGYPIRKFIPAKSELYGYVEGKESDNYLSQSSSYKVEIKDKIYIIRDTLIAEVYNSSGNPRSVSLDGLQLTKVTAAASSENYYYIAGVDSTNKAFLVKINPNDDTWTYLLPENGYEVFSFTASETDGITFNALRMSDGKKVIGKVGINGGDVTMIDEESNAEITYLERVN